jgi:hypothetical protein
MLRDERRRVVKENRMQFSNLAATTKRELKLLQKYFKSLLRLSWKNVSISFR